jgi:hypothetical protein
MVFAALGLAGVLAVAQSVPPTPPAPTANLAELEGRSPQNINDPKAVLAFNAEVIALAGSGALTTGDEFYRAAKLIFWDGNDYRLARVRYELLLTAIAKDQPDAAKEISVAWDNLMSRVGRPLRFDLAGLATRSPGSIDLDAAPACIQGVWRDPATARIAAAAATQNAEMKAIVDADQSDRKNWEKRTPEQRTATMTADRERNARTREIIRSGELHTVTDFANASLVMQHSPKFDGYQLAHELAVCALLLGDRGFGRWLVAATYDRMLGSLGHDQRFGTQSMGGSKVRIDLEGITDLQRQALGCPPLAATSAVRPMDVSKELIAPDGWLRDAKTGLAMKIPAGWTIADGQRDDVTSGVGFAISEKPDVHPRIYCRIYPVPQPAPASGFETALREDARSKANDRVRSIPDYVNRADSFVSRTIDNRPALSWTADYTEGGRKYSEYLVRACGPKSKVLFFVTGPTAGIDALRPTLDDATATLKLP